MPTGDNHPKRGPYKTHCIRGHLRTPENVSPRFSCKRCQAEYRAQHLKETREYNQNYYAENSEKSIKASCAWARNHPEQHTATEYIRRCRMAGNGGVHTGEQFIALCRHFNYRCLCCGQSRKLAADHVISVKQSISLMLPLNFLNDIDNIQPLCKRCNSKKNIQHIDYRTNPHPACIQSA